MGDIMALGRNRIEYRFAPFIATHKRAQREKQDGPTNWIYEAKPLTRDHRPLASPDIPEATKAKLRTEPAGRDRLVWKKSIEASLRNFFTVAGNLNRAAMKT